MRVLVSGYYGFANLGDDALLEQLISGLRRRYPLAEIDVLSATPEVTAHELRVDATPRMDLRAIAHAVERSDVVLSGGGGLLQNATSLKSLLYYAGILRTAARSGKKALIFAQSIGPLDYWGKQTVRRFCSGIAAATVRDEASRELLHSLLPEVPIERTADLVFLYDPPEVPVDLAPHGIDAAAGPLVVVAVRKTARFEEAATATATAVDMLGERYGAQFAFVPFGGEADAEAATVVIRKCRSKAVLVGLSGIDAVAAAIARADLVIGARLHALILAARFGTPFLALAYDPKVDALGADLEYPLPPLWSTRRAAARADVESLAADAWERRGELAGLLRDRLPAMRAAAERNFDALARAVSA